MNINKYLFISLLVLISCKTKTGKSEIPLKFRLPEEKALWLGISSQVKNESDSALELVDLTIDTGINLTMENRPDHWIKYRWNAYVLPTRDVWSWHSNADDFKIDTIDPRIWARQNIQRALKEGTLSVVDTSDFALIKHFSIHDTLQYLKGTGRVWQSPQYQTWSIEEINVPHRKERF